MTEIRTSQIRLLPSRHIGRQKVRATYIDRPASLSTFVDHCEMLLKDVGLTGLECRMLGVRAPKTATEVCQTLFAALAEFF